jgi:hypothetical protein
LVDEVLRREKGKGTRLSEEVISMLRKLLAGSTLALGLLVPLGVPAAADAHPGHRHGPRHVYRNHHRGGYRVYYRTSYAGPWVCYGTYPTRYRAECVLKECTPRYYGVCIR